MSEKMRKKMTGLERAKQFAPFDAVAGLSEALEAVRQRKSSDDRRELTEERKKELFGEILSLQPGVDICITCYKDSVYRDYKGEFVRFDRTKNVLYFADAEFAFADISNVYIL